MRHLILLFTALSLTLLAHAQANHDFHWIHPWTVNFYPSHVAADQQGHSYAAGNFSGTRIFGSDTLVSLSNSNVFLVKYDVNGAPLWARRFGGSATDIVYGLEVDPLGNVYVSGSYHSSMTVAGVTFTASQYGNYFLLKYSPSGTLQWAAEGGGGGADFGDQMGFDAQGNVYMCGSFGNATTINGQNFTGPGFRNAFIVKYSPTGQFISFNAYGGENWVDNGARGIAVMPDGSHYLLGQMDTIVYLGTDTLHGRHDAWVARFDANGTYQWSRSMEGPDYQVWYDIATAANGDIYLLGDFYDTLHFAGNTYPMQGGQNDIIVAKYDIQGNLLYHRVIASPGDDYGQGIAAYPNGDYVITGGYSAGADFGSGPQNIVGAFDTYIAKYSSNGTLQWLETGGSNGPDRGNSVSVDGQGRIYCSLEAPTSGNPFLINGQSFTMTGGIHLKILENANHIHGRVAMDYNHNSIYEASDIPWNGGQVDLNPYLQMRLTDSDGAFDFHADTGSYTLSLPQPPSYYTLSPATHAASFPTLGLIDTANYFLLEPIPGITDVRVSLNSYNSPSPGRPYWLQLSYQNLGTDTASGVVALEHHHRAAYQGATPLPGSIVADTLFWNYSNLLPWETRSIQIELQPDTLWMQGQQMLSYARITPLATDVQPSNNRDTLNAFITTSYDPNDKLVMPAGPLTPADVQAGAWLTYTIRFQNTGNDTAWIVRLIDTLQATLRPETMALIDASHPATFSLHGNVAAWRFEDIRLPDSLSNPGGSMGYATFKIQTVAGLSAGSQVDNFADIYFDYNAPVRTPTATVLIQEPASAQPGLDDQLQLSLYPNPNDGHFSVRAAQDLPKAVTFTLIDLQGRSAWSLTQRGLAAGRSVALGDASLPAGIYVLEARAADQVWRQKVVVR